MTSNQETLKRGSGEAAKRSAEASAMMNVPKGGPLVKRTARRELEGYQVQATSVCRREDADLSSESNSYFAFSNQSMNPFGRR